MHISKELIQDWIKDYRQYSTKQLVKWMIEHDMETREAIYLSYINPNYRPSRYLCNYMEMYNDTKMADRYIDMHYLIGHENNYIETVLRERYEKQEKKEPFFELFVYNILKGIKLGRKYTEGDTYSFLHESYKQLELVDFRNKHVMHWKSTKVLKDKYNGDRVYLVVSNAIKDVPLGAKVIGFDEDKDYEYYNENYVNIKYVHVNRPYDDAELVITRTVHKSKLLEIEAD